MCGYLNRMMRFLEVCSCGLFSAPVQKLPKTPKSSYGSNVGYKNVSVTPPGQTSSDVKVKSTTSSESVHSYNSFDDNFPDLNKSTNSYSDWTFVKCLNENPQSKIDVMKNNFTNQKCSRKLYFKKETSS